jgi:hypothetical protein
MEVFGSLLGASSTEKSEGKTTGKGFGAFIGLGGISTIAIISSVTSLMDWASDFSYYFEVLHWTQGGYTPLADEIVACAQHISTHGNFANSTWTWQDKDGMMQWFDANELGESQSLLVECNRDRVVVVSTLILRLLLAAAIIGAVSDGCKSIIVFMNERSAAQRSTIYHTRMQEEEGLVYQKDRYGGMKILRRLPGIDLTPEETQRENANFVKNMKKKDLVHELERRGLQSTYTELGELKSRLLDALEDGEPLYNFDGDNSNEDTMQAKIHENKRAKIQGVVGAIGVICEDLTQLFCTFHVELTLKPAALVVDTGGFSTLALVSIIAAVINAFFKILSGVSRARTGALSKLDKSEQEVFFDASSSGRLPQSSHIKFVEALAPKPIEARTFNISGQGLGPAIGAMLTQDVLPHMTKLKTLNLHGNILGIWGWSKTVNASLNETMMFLKVFGDELGADSGQYSQIWTATYAKAFVKHIKIGRFDYLAKAKARSDTEAHARMVHLGLDLTSFAHICNALPQALLKLNELTTLVLSENGFSADCSAALFEVLPSLTKLESFTFTESDLGLEIFSRGLLDKTWRGEGALGNEFEFSRDAELEDADKWRKTAGGVLATTLPQLKTLTHLNLSDNFSTFSCPWGPRLAEQFSTLTNLTTLDLHGNREWLSSGAINGGADSINGGVDSGAILMKSLENLTKLQSLNLDNINLSDEANTLFAAWTSSSQAFEADNPLGSE